MNDLITTSTRPRPCQPRSWLLPMVATLALHTAAAWGLYASWSPEPPAGHSQPVMITQLVTLPAPAPEPEPVPPPAVEPVAVDPEPTQIEEPQVDHAAIARKRLEEQQQKEHKEREAQQRLAEQRRQQEQERERERERQQQLAREQQERERAEQQRQAAEAQARANAEAARRAAEAAAIAQYQPISKQPPSYPRRALDRGLEGDCTVTYTVTRDGRVKNPQVVEGACDDPLFERPSLTAARSFRYQPRLINGQPVDVPGIRNTFRYRIQ